MFILDLKTLSLNTLTLTYWQVINDIKSNVNKLNIYNKNQNKLGK